MVGNGEVQLQLYRESGKNGKKTTEKKRVKYKIEFQKVNPCLEKEKPDEAFGDQRLSSILESEENGIEENPCIRALSGPSGIGWSHSRL